MTTLYFSTTIKAPIQTVFDAARDIGLHQESTNTTNEKAIAGRTSGLIELYETVTFKAKHFGVYLTHTSKITEMKIPYYFVDEMIKGLFQSFRHRHSFEEKNGITIMTDEIQYETPFGILGKLFNSLLLKKHLQNFLLERNRILKEWIENQLPQI